MNATLRRGAVQTRANETPPPVVDVHTHVFSTAVLRRRQDYAARDRWFAHLHPPASRRLASPARLVAAMDATGVDVACALSFGWADQGLCVQENDCVLDAARLHPGRILPFCTVQPAAGAAAVAEIERVARLGCRGIGELFPDGQGFALDDAGVLGPVVEACAAHRLVLVVHGSEPLGRSYAGRGRTTPDRLFALAALCAAVAPELPVVFAHLGGGLPFYETMPEVQRLARNLYYDTGAAAYVYTPAALRLVAAVAPDRLLFGSDYPVIGVARMLEYVRAAGLAPETERAVLGGSAARLLQLD
jgi:predicted TIM-barrel fold metal-dependent hydrolase